MGFGARALEGLVAVTTADFVVVGGGVIGLSIARELRRRHTDAAVIVLEKEDAPGRHASGRNSGVLHAGFYYSPDSLKARFTRLGNLAMKDYCDSRGLRVRRCGKLVVATTEAEVDGLRELKRRGDRNGIELVELDEARARELEPRARTIGHALYSPTTASVDPSEVMASLARDAANEGVRVLAGTRYLARSNGAVRTSAGEIVCGFVVNAAGLYADRVARDFGHSQNHRILPFKGLYLVSREPAGAFRTHLYPVPNLANPFLGVHVTVTVDGRAKIGPTAIPCLWREQYGWRDGFRASEAREILGLGTRLWFHAGFDFRGLAWQEIQKYVKVNVVARAARLANGVRAVDYVTWGKPGIRAQLVDLRTRTLEQDFVIESDPGSLHVLNAVSPGWTCSLPFSEHVCDRIDAELGGSPRVSELPPAMASAQRH
jgi:(S)-2-hydroxyglutarate dehydrogenase